MISVSVSFGMVLLFLVSGRLFEAFKYLIKTICDGLLKLLNLFGVGINLREKKIKTSKEFKNTFKDIKTVKKSKVNEKIKPSINIAALVILVVSITLIVINLEAVSGNCISIWLYEKKIFSFFINS
jgi:hypothetical protein